MKGKSYPYERTTLYADKNVEVVLIEWPPGTRSVAHDHGNSHGTIRVLAGVVYCDNFSKRTKRFSGRAIGRKNDMLFETTDIIHIMGNNSKAKVARALHVYMPPLKMKTYQDSVLKFRETKNTKNKAPKGAITNTE